MVEGYCSMVRARVRVRARVSVRVKVRIRVRVTLRCSYITKGVHIHHFLGVKVRVVWLLVFFVCGYISLY